MKVSLRTKVLLSVGLIIIMVLGTNTFVHIRNLRQNYLEAIGWRSEALSQGMLKVIKEYSEFSANIQSTLESLAIECMDIYDLNKDKNVTHIAVINEEGLISAHNQEDHEKTSIESPLLLDNLKRQELITVLEGSIYHTFIPIFGKKGTEGTQDVYLGAVDIGFPKSVVDKKIQQLLKGTAGLFVLYLVLALSSISLLMHLLLTKPVGHLVTVGQQLANGKLVTTSASAERGDEIGLVADSFNQISEYLTDIANVASQIATGVLAGEIKVRSQDDVLGKAVQNMILYLKNTAEVMTGITGGDLTKAIRMRSADDALGQVIQSMTEGLKTLIVQIRASAEQIALTGTSISQLADSDIRIVEKVHNSMEKMMSTMTETGSSVEEVAHNMNTLSASVRETSMAVGQMTSAIAQVASNTTDLKQQTQQTIESLNETVMSLEGVVESTDVSKQLSEETIQDALEGQEAVEQVTRSMETIQHTITTAVDNITRFASRSRDIDTILDVIRNITEQTSLLALNASIIAAQAGAHGRGFAVVADEIKGLADGVETSTKDIAAIVHTLQQDTNQVVQSINEGAEDVKQGMKRTQQARATLQKITNSAQRSSAVVAEITEALHGLMKTSRSVALAMEQVNTMTDHITMATKEQEKETEHINNAIEHINDLASQIQKATTEQLTAIHQLLDATNDVTNLNNQNLESSQYIAATTSALASQADILLKSVDRFKLSVK